MRDKKNDSAAIARLIESEIKEVVGCTEPASIAYACARCMRLLKNSAEGVSPSDVSVELSLSRDVLRNASTVKVPVLKLRGIKPAVVCGLYGKDSSFNPFATVEEVPRGRLKALLAKRNLCDIADTGRDGLYVDVSVKTSRCAARVVIEDRHDNIIREYINGRIISKSRPTSRRNVAIGGTDRAAAIVARKDKSLLRIARVFLLNQARLIKSKDNFRPTSETARLIYERMEGSSLGVQTLTGSGNQGIFLGVPFYKLYMSRGDKTLDALLFSILIQIYLTRRMGRISSLCGLAYKSGPSLVAGLSYLYGKSPAAIRRDMDLSAEVFRGMACEGAMPSCAHKAFAILSFIESKFIPFGGWK
jgi:L-cysteine desulfidase